MLKAQSLTVHPQQPFIAVIGYNWVSLLGMTPVAMHIKALLALPSVLPTLTGQPIWLPIHSGPYSGPFSRDLPLRTPKDTTFLMGVEAAAGPTGLIRNACFVGKILLLRSAQSHESPQIRPEPNTGKQTLSTTSPCRLLTF